MDNIEILYGPASALHGANAFRRVINLITCQQTGKDGVSGQAQMAGGGLSRRVGDAHVLFRQGIFKLVLNVRENQGEVDPSKLETYEFTKHRYLTDRRIWGPFPG